MKLTLTSTLALLAATCADAFTRLSGPTPFVVSQPVGSISAVHMTPKSMEDEVEEMVQKELKKTRRMSNLRNEKGIAYAPWMNISREDEEEIRSMMRDKAAARRRRFENAEVKGNLLRDSAFQELSGTGLKSKVINGNDVELEWATAKEANSKGFIVKRRAAKTTDFQEVASYKTYGPLASQGSEGGVYRYLDEDVPPGGWVYRVTECEANGQESDLSQCLVEIQTQQERIATLIGVGVFGAAAAGAIAAGFLLDPLQ